MTSTLYDACERWMADRKIGFYDIFLPYYVASACCHVINLENKKREFYFEHGQPADLRLHMFICAPPGFMKSFILKRCLDRRNSLFGGTSIKTSFLGEMTTAGFVGTTQNIDGESVEIEGAAYEFREHILGIDEFSVITNMMSAEHSKNLDNAMLTALDSGYIIKRLASGEIRYETYLTLHTGSQPARFNLSSGLGRRFCMICFIPTREQQRLMVQYRRQGKGVHGSSDTAAAMEYLVDKFVADMQTITEVTFADEIYTKLDEMQVPHFEETLYEKIALGLNLATKSISGPFKVTLSPLIEQAWKLEYDWRVTIKSGAQDAQVMQIIVDNPGVEEGTLKKMLLNFGLSYMETYIALENLLKQHRVAAYTDKPKTFDPHKPRRRFYWPLH